MKEVLIPLQAYILGRSGSRIAGLLLLLSLIWWGGPYVGLAGTWSRLGVMIAVVVIALAWFVGRRIVIHRRSGEFKAQLQASAGPGRQAEIEELQQKMDAAIASLKSSGVGVKYKGSSALYALPWYLIIGPAAAGKTTLLRNSGLHFPYAQGDDIDIKGFGGTRNCDWWFADEAVLLDTAGRYTTEEDDRQEWFAFLGMLRKYRPRTPLNGVIVAVSLVDLLTADDGGLEWHVKVIRERLDELIRQLGCIFPVYLVVTKVDLLGGFNAFFDDLGDHDRGQVWGTWLLGEGSGADLARAFREKLADLHARLCELRLRKLSMQRNLERKGEIFDFPAQFVSASERLGDFFRLLAKENPYQETPRFCGVYLTSGTQEGTPLQRLVGNMRQAFGYLETPVHAVGKRTTRSYFIKKLFQEVIFPNSRDTTRNRRRDVVNRWLKGAWVTAALAAVAGSVLLFSTSLTSNALLAHRGSEAAKELETRLTAGNSAPEKTFQAAADLHAHYRQLLAYEERLPLHLLFGIYAGGEQKEPVLSLLLEGLTSSFFRPAVATLQYRIENYGRQWEVADGKGREKIREPYYQALKTYLMLVRPDRLEADYVTPALTALWRDDLKRKGGARPEEDPQAMQEMVALYLHHLGKPSGEGPSVPPAELKELLVAAARAHLRAAPDGVRLYGRVRSKEYKGLADLSLPELVKGEGASLLEGSGRIPGIFTARGWKEFVAPEIRAAASSASRGDWVLGQGHVKEGPADPQAVAHLEKEIRQLYFADYAEAWFSFLEGVRLTSFGSPGEGAKKLQLFGRSDGPLGELMRNVAANINPEEPAGAERAAVPPRPVPELEGAFADLRKLANPADKMTVSLLVNQYLLSVASVQGEMERLSAAADVPREASQFAARVLGGGSGDCEIYRGMVSTTSLLNALEPRTRRIASNLMSSPIRHAWNSVLGEATRDLQQQWASVVAVYGRKLKGRFPFANEGSDAALADVADFFRPQDGIFWSFVNTNLAPFLTQGRGEWRTKTWLDMGPTFNRQLLVSINRAQAISSSLFRRGSDEPGVEFYLYPVPAKGVSETLLTTNGQEYRYRNEPQEWRKFRWPGDAENLGAKVSGVAGRVSRGELSRDGIWGLFHLMRRARVVQESGTQYLSIWELEGNNGLPVTVQFRIKADRENNLFDRKILAGFDLPESIF